eukprot:EC096064.1.p2 GENE.EC096064.1~~EC096064.1.p2  ORF type:complete len:145 (+),score=2.00 EC096064.1:43-477(+)
MVPMFYLQLLSKNQKLCKYIQIWCYSGKQFSRQETYLFYFSFRSPPYKPGSKFFGKNHHCHLNVLISGIQFIRVDYAQSSIVVFCVFFLSIIYISLNIYINTYTLVFKYSFQILMYFNQALFQVQWNPYNLYCLTNKIFSKSPN